MKIIVDTGTFSVFVHNMAAFQKISTGFIDVLTIEQCIKLQNMLDSKIFYTISAKGTNK